MKRLLASVVWTFLLLPWSGVGAQYDSLEHERGVRQESREYVPGQTTDKQKPRSGEEILPLDRLMNRPVVQSGARIGELTNLLVHPETGSIVHAVVSRGGILQPSQDKVLLPWSSLSLDFEKNRLELESGFEPDQATAYQPEHAGIFLYGEAGLGSVPGGLPADEGGQEQKRVLVEASRLVNRIVAVQGKELGEIETIYLEPRQGKLLFALLELGYPLGLGGETILLPIQGVRIDTQGRLLETEYGHELVTSAPKVSEYSVPSSAEMERARNHFGLEQTKPGSTTR